MQLPVHLFIAGASETIENLLVELDIGTIDKILSRLEIFTIIDWMSFTDNHVVHLRDLTLLGDR